MITRELLQNLQSIPNPKTRKFINNTAANGTHTLAVYEQEVYIDNDASYTETLTLPNVSAAKGLTYSIFVVDDGGHATVDDVNDEGGFTGLTSSADNAYLVLYSDGKKWYNLVSASFA